MVPTWLYLRSPHLARVRVRVRIRASPKPHPTLTALSLSLTPTLSVTLTHLASATESTGSDVVKEPRATSSASTASRKARRA